MSKDVLGHGFGTVPTKAPLFALLTHSGILVVKCKVYELSFVVELPLWLHRVS